MIRDSYGNAWQEFRAYLATVLIGWAQSIHFGATMDLAKCLAALEAEATAAIRVAAMKAEDRDQMPPWAAERLARIETIAADDLPPEQVEADDATCDVPDARPIFINPDARP